MKQYDSHKNSGVEWIGEVPIHWNVMPLKFTGTFGNGLTYSPKDVVDNGILVIRSSNIQNSSLSFEDNVYVNNVAKELLVHKGDIIICSRNGSAALVGKSAFIENDINATFGAFMMRYIPKINKKYGFYLFQSAIGRYKGYFATTTINQLTKSTIGEMKVPLASTNEQQAIVDYLDKKCSEIDNIIYAQQNRIALLQELKQSIITHAVTKGINPNVEMKDSGVEWIGKIPTSWEVVHLKRILRERMQYGANEPAESDDTTYPRYIRITDITANGELRPETFKSLEPSKAKDYLLDKGDVLFARSGATVGKTFLFNADIKACYAGYLIKASCDKRRMLPEYLYYYTQSGAYECWKNSVFIQSTIQNIGADKYQMMYIPVPSKDEQKQIVEYTMSKSQIFDAAISKAQHQVELLQEYKQSLITEVVTGKRKVS